MTPAKVALRGIGGREIALHGLAIAAAVRGKPLAPWLAVSIAGDLNDIAATFAGAPRHPRRRRRRRRPPSPAARPC